jgi:hypothetical protein
MEYVAPWTRALRASTWLLVVITLALDAAVPLHWASWPMLLDSIPCGVAGVAGGLNAGRDWYTRLKVLVVGAISFWVACVSSVLLIFPGPAAVLGAIIMFACAAGGSLYLRDRMLRP